MTGDNFTDGSRKARPALADVTNKPGKREFSFISGDSRAKSGDGVSRTVECAKEDMEFAKKVRLRVENLVKDLCKDKFGVDCPEKALEAAKPENDASVVGNVDDKVDKTADTGVTVAHTGVKLGEASTASCVPSVLMPTCSKKGGDEGVSNVCSVKDVGVGRLASSKCGFERSVLPNSQGSKFELERCGGLKGDGCVNLNADANLLKDCSCSFCSKAAYIWADLHYQDIKGRIAALKKSQKEASFLVQKCAKGKETDIPGRGNSDKSAKLESDLMSQWRSLFLHMEDIFVCESNQLQASFVMLKDLRENCKMDLENMNVMPSDKH